MSSNKSSVPSLQRHLRERSSNAPSARRGDTLLADLDEYGDYGTALVVLLLVRDGFAHISWLGDAMSHRVSGDDIESLTWPHTLLNDAIHSGQLTQEGTQGFSPNLNRVLCRYLGVNPFPDPLEVISFTPESGDRLILTTDGVHDTLPPSRLLEVCRSHPEPQVCADRLVALALEQGSRDNRTCVVVAFDGPELPPEAPETQPRRWWWFW